MIAGYPNSAMEKLLDVYEENMKELLQKRGIAFESSFRAYTNSWKDDNLGRKIANQMIDSGVDMLFVSHQLKGDNISIGIKEEIFEPVYSEQIPQEIRMKVSDAMK